MINNKPTHKYKAQYTGTYERTQTYTNGTPTLQMGASAVISKILRIHPYKSKTDVDYVHA